MTINLNKLTLKNFKGIRDLTVEFNQQTDILGENGTGKSTIFDAFTFLLFGKDGRDNKDFNIKTLVDGVATPMLEHSVEGILTTDGTELTLRRTYSEKWTRRRGSEESELTGHETLFYYNGVPQQAGEYKSKIDSLISEGLFKLITSATAFNSLPWQKRREVLISIAGEISDDSVLKGMTKAQVSTLTNILSSGKPLVDFRKEVAMRKKKLSDDIKAIPPRVDECKRSIPEPVDFEKVSADIYAKQTTLLEVENAITDQVNAYQEQGEQIRLKQNDINKLKAKVQQIEFDAKSVIQAAANERTMKINDLKQKGAALVSTRIASERSMETMRRNQGETESKITNMRLNWGTISAETLTFREGEFICPTCKRELDPGTIGTRQGIMTADFEKDKTRRLAEIQAEGKRMGEMMVQLVLEIGETEKSIAYLTFQINELAVNVREAEATTVTQDEVDMGLEAHDILKQIEVMELSMLEVPRLNVDGLKQQKGAIQVEIDSLKAQLSTKDAIDRGEKRVKELLKEEKELAQQIADLEKQEFALDAYVRSRIDQVEKQVNGKFKLVKFRMFQTLINGGIEECCDTLLNGVPYSDVNSAGKIQAGIDIINTLTEHYGVWAPVWIDNRESTNEIPECKSQVINLIVSHDKNLVIK